LNTQFAFNSLCVVLKGEYDRQLQEAERMKIELTVSRRRIIRVITIGKAC
jgi:hypothetical protein